MADLPLVDHFGGGSLRVRPADHLWGTGAIVGSSIAARIPARHELTALTVGSAAMAISLGSIAVVPNLPLAIVVGTIGGAGSGIAFTPWFSLLQRMTPDRDRGTAFAMAETFEQTSFVAGMVAAGALISILGVQPTYLVSGLLLALAAGTARRLARPRPLPHREPVLVLAAVVILRPGRWRRLCPRRGPLLPHRRRVVVAHPLDLDVAGARDQLGGAATAARVDERVAASVHDERRGAAPPQSIRPRPVADHGRIWRPTPAGQKHRS